MMPSSTRPRGSGSPASSWSCFLGGLFGNRIFRPGQATAQLRGKSRLGGGTLVGKAGLQSVDGSGEHTHPFGPVHLTRQGLHRQGKGLLAGLGHRFLPGFPDHGPQFPQPLGQVLQDFRLILAPENKSLGDLVNQLQNLRVFHQDTFSLPAPVRYPGLHLRQKIDRLVPPGARELEVPDSPASHIPHFIKFSSISTNN
jgi:hypothetical protein